jgi:hypothetical protein
MSLWRYLLISTLESVLEDILSWNLTDERCLLWTKSDRAFLILESVGRFFWIMYYNLLEDIISCQNEYINSGIFWKIYPVRKKISTLGICQYGGIPFRIYWEIFFLR